MNYKHYYKTDKTIGTGDIVFRHFTATPPVIGGKSRFVQFLEGTLTELIPEDFGDITVIPDYFLLTGLDNITPLEKITFPDSVTTFGTSADVNMCNMQIAKDLTIVFPKNVTKFNNTFANLISHNSSLDVGVIYDFSKATKVPDITGVQSTSFSSAKEIRVPSGLHSAWISNWSGVLDNDKKEKIVAV